MTENGNEIIKAPDNKLEQFMELLSKYYTTNKKEEIAQFIYDYCIEEIKFE